jgi:hypothetical protein
MNARLLPIVLAFGITLQAAPVDIRLSERLAANFIQSMPHIFSAGYSISDTEEISENGIVLFRIYRLSPQGFIVMAADNSVRPVLAFSADGEFSGSNLPGWQQFVKKWKYEVAQASRSDRSPSADIVQLWKNLADGNYALNSEKTLRSVSPMLTTKWNQDYPYNAACPPDPEGPGGRTYAGCVATAMGQLMFYHRWPLSGLGSYSYVHPDYGTISADFSTALYNWNAMPNRVTTENMDVAVMLHHLGVSVDMNYGPNGSGMWNHSAARSFRNYFKYVPETRYVFRDSTTLNWDSLVVTNLNDGKPLYYAGWEDTTYTMGHAFVCDGYETNDYYHFNWGWGGSYDGYFYTGQLNPGGANFNLCQELIVDMYPDTSLYTYPQHCQGLQEINSVTGTFTDGSGNKNYPAGSDCSWWLNPSCGILPELSFDAFSLNPSDTLYIFEGSPSSHYLKTFFTGDYPPFLNSTITPTMLRTDSGSFYVIFRSHGENQGFVASYNTIFCLGNDTITENQGIIADGSSGCDYRRSTNCRWLMEVPGTQVYHFTTEEFDLYSASTAHSLQIYKESISSANLVYKFTAAAPPPASFYIEATKLHFRFLTTSVGSGQGWTFTYRATPLSAPATTTGPEIFIFPNPVGPHSVLYTKETGAELTISVSDITGKILCSVNQSPGESGTVLLENILPNLSSGYYFLNVTGKTGKATAAFVVE